MSAEQTRIILSSRNIRPSTTPSPVVDVNTTPAHNSHLPQRASVLPWVILITLLLCAYVLPWVTGQARAFSLNAHDFAEWSSLHPAVREPASASGLRALLPAYADPLLLRSHLLIVVVLLTSLNIASRWLAITVIIVTAAVIVAQLPPVDQIVQTADPNYLQQTLLASLSALWFVLMLWPRFRNRVHMHYPTIVFVAGCIGMAATVFTILISVPLFTGYSPTLLSAIGPWMMLVIYLCALAEASYRWRLDRAAARIADR